MKEKETQEAARKFVSDRVDELKRENTILIDENRMLHTKLEANQMEMASIGYKEAQMEEQVR